MLGRRRRAPDIAGRVADLEGALAAGEGYLDPDAVEQARAVLARTGQRLRLGADKTVVALAGATGSGKSSLFNALAGMEISDVGVRRPTTRSAMACVWGEEGADALLDWLDVPRRHRLQRESVLDADRQAALQGLVLLDLPDHDSTEVAHRLEVDRLVDLVDLLVWVVDPQKYADELLHARYLRRLTGHDQVMIVVLNQVDRLTPADAEICRSDLRRLLDADGLPAVRLFPVSARRGDGVEELRTLLADVARKQVAVAERAAADLDAAAAALRRGVSDTEPGSVRPLAGSDDLVQALSVAAGVPVVLDAVAADYRRRAAQHVGWPFTRWVARLRPDPLRRLRLGQAAGAGQGVAAQEPELLLTRSSLPPASPAQEARVDLAVRALTRQAASGLPPRWADGVRQAAEHSGAEMSDALDTAVLSVDLAGKEPAWWRATGVAHVVLAWCAIAGFAWLTGLAVLAWLQIPLGDAPRLGGRVPLPTVLFLGGLLGGIALSFMGRWLVQSGVRRRRSEVGGRMRAAIQQRAAAMILDPVSEVLERHATVRQHLTQDAHGR